MKGDHDEDITIIIAHLSPDTDKRGDEGPLLINPEGGGMFSIFACAPDVQRTWWNSTSVTGTVIDVERDVGCHVDPIFGGVDEADVDPGEVMQVARKLMGFALQLIHVMSLMKDDTRQPLVGVEQSSFLKKASKNKREVWTTPWVGRTYKFATARSAAKVSGQGHASPGTHWRRGHFAQQHFGPKMGQVKTIWRQPVLVNP
jgi:hypothetical protein